MVKESHGAEIGGRRQEWRGELEGKNRVDLCVREYGQGMQTKTIIQKLCKRIYTECYKIVKGLKRKKKNGE